MIGDLLWLQRHRPLSDRVGWRFEQGYNYSYEDETWNIVIEELLRNWIIYSPADTATEFAKYIDDPEYRIAILNTFPTPNPASFIPILIGLISKAQELTNEEVIWLVTGTADIVSSEAESMLNDLDRQVRGRSEAIDRSLDTAWKRRGMIDLWSGQ